MAAPRTIRTLLGGLALAAALLFAAQSPATAELAKKGNLVVSFHGEIAPQRLPRTQAAPVAVRMGGKIKTTDRTTPPKLERIVLEINRHGRLQSQGLAVCPLQRLESISSSEARRVCGDAQIGHGNVTSRISLPGQGAFASNGPLLAFNGRYKGRPAILAQVATQAPLPLTYVIVFELRKSAGTFGTTLIGTLPPIASSYGYISAFDLALARRYTHAGKRKSFAAADCPAPAGFTSAPFPLARASFEFDDGRSVSAKLVRECKVRGK
ncbi:MAG TPA: hypothetical protein VN752_00730 [Solirubrobacterales bacterium]|nr:hypothetical protein [Solirubrobacterales bacterium]